MGDDSTRLHWPFLPTCLLKDNCTLTELTLSGRCVARRDNVCCTYVLRTFELALQRDAQYQETAGTLQGMLSKPFSGLYFFLQTMYLRHSIKSR